MDWLTRGWQVFEAEAGVMDWLRSVNLAALQAAADPELRKNWLRCDGTWFVGVDALQNDGHGRVAGGPALSGSALVAAEAVFGKLHLHRGQVSVTYPGYPRQGQGESESAYRFRLIRDAAHLDGLLALGPDRRRYLKEPHAWILGFPLTKCSADAAPLVVWEGSHEIMRARMGAALSAYPERDWPEVDLTEAYQAARREVFETCHRVVVSAHPGQAQLVHRLAIHGVAPWAEGAMAPPEGRAILYFRPECPGGIRQWLEMP